MTALAGCWHRGAPSRAVEACRAMLAAQSVYAPDEPESWSQGDVAIGRRLFRRLPEDRHDHGPVVGGGGTLALVADVRLDNRDELGRALGMDAAQVAEMADAGLLMRALERWEEAAVDRLAGDFAFALWDSRRRRLLLARDFLGMRPLFYHRHRNFVAFASMAKGLHALPEIERAADPAAAANFIALRPESGSRSFFAGIERVEPGHFVTIDENGMQACRYWAPSLEQLRFTRAEDYVEGLRERLDAAVKARLRGGQGHVGAQLSAGLDSSAVTATAALLLATEGRVTAFTAVPRPGYRHSAGDAVLADEGPLAAAAAALHPNIDHVLVAADGASPLAGLDRAFFLYERPVLNICNAVWTNAIFDAAKARGVGVLLTGSAGNLTISHSGMERLSVLLAEGRIATLLHEARKLRENGMRRGTIIGQLVTPWLPDGVRALISRLRGKGTDRNAARAHSPHAHARGETRPRPTAGAAARVWALGRIDRGNYNKGVLGGWGIDLRDPTADRALVEYCLRVPLDQFLRDGETRSLVRRALADRVPDMVLRERRKGYQSADWHEGFSAARDDLSEELRRIRACRLASDIIDLNKLSAWHAVWPDGRWESQAIVQRYRLALLRGVSLGHFLRNAEEDDIRGPRN